MAQMLGVTPGGAPSKLPQAHSWSSWASGLTTMTEGSFEQQMAAAFAATHLESMCELDIDSEPHIHRMTGIVCTIGLFISLGYHAVKYFILNVAYSHGITFLYRPCSTINYITVLYNKLQIFNYSLHLSSITYLYISIYNINYRSCLQRSRNIIFNDECWYEYCTYEFLTWNL